MKNALMFALICVSSLFSCDSVHARGWRRGWVGSGTTVPAPPGADVSTAQGVANAQAAMNRMAHLGGNTSYEGVGFSTYSADDAIRRCCYYGQRVAVDIGVARGASGWYACVRYQ